MEPQPNSAAVAAVSPPARRRFPRASRSALSNDPAFLAKQPLSPRAQDRRRKDLAMAFVNALGGEQACSELTMVAVRRAVELTVTAEMTRAAVLTGSLQGLVIADLIKLENAARRAVLALGIKLEKPRGGDGGLTIARARWEEQQEQAKAREATTAKDTEAPPDDRSA
jgi:hypothetical protein